jgi:hypothetical protein
VNDAKNAKEFIDLLAAAMCDAAIEGKCTQLQTTIRPPGRALALVRIVVVPEQLDFVRSSPDAKFERPA